MPTITATPNENLSLCNFRLTKGLNSLNDAVVITDADRNVVYYNDSAVKIFTAAESEIQKKFPSFNVNKMIGVNIVMFHKNTNNQKELIKKLSSCQEFTMTLGKHQVSVRPSTINDDDGNIIGYMGVFKDITEREKNKAALLLLNKQVNQMQKIESLSRLTAGIAHDFNNILNCILGYNELNLLLAEDCPDEQRKADFIYNVNAVNVASKRASSLISKMLAYSRQNSADKDIEIRPTQEVIYDVASMVGPALTSRFHLETNVDNYLDIQIDAIDLHQILTNLIINARDSMKNGGTIVVSLKQVNIHNQICTSCAQHIISNDYIELRVLDTGTGIDQTVIDHIFDPFFTTKPIGEGTGLGLSTVSGMVHDANGHIIVDSNTAESNHGTAFRLLFPLIEINY
jgi:two-component system cell cycle sensor histidine kinase/response regulator CckA